jgi:hypothetical protein
MYPPLLQDQNGQTLNHTSVLNLHRTLNRKNVVMKPPPPPRACWLMMTMTTMADGALPSLCGGGGVIGIE